MDHPIFAKVYTRFQNELEAMVGLDRQRQNSRARGKTLIIGAGTGLDIAPLTNAVTRITLLEPDRSMQTYLRRHYAGYTMLEQSAENVPEPDESYDTVITSLVLCSVLDVDQVLREIYRVLKRGGQYLFLEHVANTSTSGKMMQDWATPVWRKMAGNCHLNREIRQYLDRSALTVTDCALVQDRKVLPIIAGRAIRES